MGSRFGLYLPLFAAAFSGPVYAQAPSGAAPAGAVPPAPISLAPPKAAPMPAVATPVHASPGQASPGQATPGQASPGQPPAPPPVARARVVPPKADTAAATAAPRSQLAMPKPGPKSPPVVQSDVRKPVSAAPPPALRQTSIGIPRTLTEALAATYANHPALQAERAKVRATDENVPTALAGWRPTVQLSGTAGYADGLSRAYNFSTNRSLKSPTTRAIATGTMQASQTLYNGGRTQASINRAKNLVMGERATLIAQEQTSFTAAVTAYVGVIQAQQQLELNRNNELVLSKQLQATNDRFRVGEITRTDVAQAQAALAGARAQRETSEGSLQTARGVFQQIIGVLPPADLVPPQPLALPLKSETEAIALAASNNPQVIAAQFADAAAKDAVEVAVAALMPQLSVQAQAFQQNNQSGWSTQANGYQVLAQLTVPVYQGGSEYAAVRQARQQQQVTQRQLDDARRTAVQNAVQAWETLVAARAAAQSTRSQIRANEIALEGVEREAIVGSRTTLDVLNAQQQLLNSRTSLVANLAQVVNASYAVAAAVGRLTARDMHLPVPLYDETAYYTAVSNRWIGLGDYATGQPGR